mgnify:CR=1 FL=1
MFYSKKQRDSLAGLSKAESKRQEFISVAVNGIENVKGLALEPGLKDQWRDIEANYIVASDEMQKRSAVLNNITSTINNKDKCKRYLFVHRELKRDLKYFDKYNHKHICHCKNCYITKIIQ